MFVIFIMFFIIFISPLFKTQMIYVLKSEGETDRCGLDLLPTLFFTPPRKPRHEDCLPYRVQGAHSMRHIFDCLRGIFWIDLTAIGQNDPRRQSPEAIRHAPSGENPGEQLFLLGHRTLLQRGFAATPRTILPAKYL